MMGDWKNLNFLLKSYKPLALFMCLGDVKLEAEISALLGRFDGCLGEWQLP